MEYVNQGATCTSASAFFAECWNAISRRGDVLALKDDLDREAFSHFQVVCARKKDEESR